MNRLSQPRIFEFKEALCHVFCKMNEYPACNGCILTEINGETAKLYKVKDMLVFPEPKVRQKDNTIYITLCKDCKHYRKELETCGKMGIFMDGEDFCSYGERK